MRRRIAVAAAGLGVALVLAVVAFLVWANMVMPGTRSAALEVWRDHSVAVTSTDHSVILSPAGAASRTGLVFIPGAKVDPYAYMYKLSGIVESSRVTVVITRPTLNLAFFDQRPLSTFTDDAPAVDRWFVGGHSLGGVRACMLADDPSVSGLVLFGSYCANDLAGSGLEVLSIAGSVDGLSTPSKIADARHLLPGDADLVEIAGLNHAGFGDYGRQPGDLEATIPREEARAEITDALAAVLGAD
jgi:hypothetical protein